MARISGRRLPQVFAALALCLSVAATAAAQTSIRVTPVPRDDRVLVSFEMAGAFTDDVRAAIQSGLQTSFSYQVELRRAVSFGFDRTIEAVTVTAQVRYDNLTRTYQVSLLQDGRVQWTRVTDKEETVRSWMTEFRQLPLFATRALEPNVEYYVRVRAWARPRNETFGLPWGRHAASGGAKFTFIP